MMPRQARLRIAMISAYLPSNSKIGVGYQVHALANGMQDRGHQVTVFSGAGPSEGARYETRTVTVGARMRSFRLAMSMRSQDLSSFDVLHAHGDDYWLWRRRVGAHVRTMHGSCLSEALRIRGAVQRTRMLALGLTEELASVVADRTVVVSPATRRWMPWVRSVIPNGVDEHVFHPSAARRTGHPTILFVGTYGRRKRGRLLMQTFADTVRPAFPDAELWMVAEDAPEAPGVVRFGRVSQEQLVDLYQRAWVFCLPSSYEGFGIPYAEAMSCGTPVVATPNPGARFVLDGGEAGVLAEPDQLGDSMVSLLGDAVLRERFARLGLSRSRDFALSTVIEKYERVYSELLASRR